MLNKFFSSLFNKNSNSDCLIFQLNDKIGPIDRFLTYEEPLDEFLKLEHYGEVIGGGTGQERTGEIAFCDIEINVHFKLPNEKIITDIIQKIESFKAPKGSKLIIKKTGNEIPFGKKEGLGLYIPKSNFQQEALDGYDINFVNSEILRLMNNKPNADRSWGGKEETALYFYSDSFEKMHNSITDFLKSYPLCKNARVIQIA